MLRLLLRRLMYIGVHLGRAVRPIALTAFVSLIFLCIIGIMAWQLWGPKQGSSNVGQVQPLAQTAAVQNYLSGRRSHNADLMWDAYSDKYQATQLNSGASKTNLQLSVNTERSAGLEFGNVEYIGGVTLDDGGSMYYYSVELSQNSQKIKMPFVFLADKSGKIDSIITPLNNRSSN